jgi:DNA processing protein
LNEGLGSDLASSTPSEASKAADPSHRINQVVLKQLKVDASTHLDTLVEGCEEVSPSEIIAALFEMEIQGLVKQLPGRNFVKVW